MKFTLPALALSAMLALGACSSSEITASPAPAIKAPPVLNTADFFPGSLTLADKTTARIYGSYNMGCIQNAVPLPQDSPDYQVQIYGAGRNYGHPVLISYLNDLAGRARAAGLPPLIYADLGKRYGGPMGKGSSHASHTSGLDADIPFQFASPRKSRAQLENPEDVYIVKGKQVTANFTPEVEKLILLAAKDRRVNRIFVAPMIKKRMCELYEGKEDAALQRLRPWFAHQAHMHVRLSCPEDSPYCKLQDPLPPGSGCGYEVESWLNPAVVKPDPNPPKPKPRVKPVLPEQCHTILKGGTI